MKRLNGEEEGSDEDDEELDVSYSDDGGKQTGKMSESESEQFFSDQDDLEDVEQADGASEEGEMDLGADMGSDYGQEYDSEMEDEEDNKKSKKKGKKEKDETGGFASYEDFAHLLEEGAEEEISKHKATMHLAKKRTHNEF